MNRPTDPSQPIRLLGVAFLVGILIETALGLVLGVVLKEPILEDGSATTLVVTLFLVGIANLVIWRLILLPMQTKAGAPLASVASLGYAFIDAPAVYGLVSAILTAEGLVALPFGAVSLVGWFGVRQSLTSSDAVARAEDFPTL